MAYPPGATNVKRERQTKRSAPDTSSFGPVCVGSSNFTARMAPPQPAAPVRPSMSCAYGRGPPNRPKVRPNSSRPLFPNLLPPASRYFGSGAIIEGTSADYLRSDKRGNIRGPQNPRRPAPKDEGQS